MATTQNTASPEELSLAGEFFHQFVDSALHWPYLMGYLFLAAFLVAGIFLPKVKFFRYAKKLGAISLCVFLYTLLVCVVYLIVGSALSAIGVSNAEVLHVTLILTSILAIVFAISILKKDTDAPS